MYPPINGQTIDDQTRCSHYHSSLDIIAIKFRCCGKYYPCHSCHQEEATHPAEVWKKEEFDTLAILCGVCKSEWSINQYLHSEARCPHCRAAFNPKCANHYHLYFEE